MIASTKAFVGSVMAIGLAVLPAWGLSGTFTDGMLETVSCLNHTTGMAVPATVTGNMFDCSTLPSTPTDRVGIVSTGTGGGTPPPTGQCTPVTDTEPNGQRTQPQDIGAITAVQCVRVTGNVSVGYGDIQSPNPSTDIDYFLLTVTGLTRVRITPVQLGTGRFALGVKDPATDADVPIEPVGQNFEFNVSSSTVRILFSKQLAGDYTIEFSDAASAIGDPSAAIMLEGSSTLEQ